MINLLFTKNPNNVFFVFLIFLLKFCYFYLVVLNIMKGIFLLEHFKFLNNVLNCPCGTGSIFVAIFNSTVSGYPGYCSFKMGYLNSVLSSSSEVHAAGDAIASGGGLR